MTSLRGWGHFRRRGAAFAGVVTLAIGPTFVVGCNRDTDRKDAAGGDTAAADAPLEADVIIRVGDKFITKQLIERELARYPESMGKTVSGRRYVVDRLVEGMLSEVEAVRENLYRDPKIEARILEHRRQILREALVERLMGSIELTDNELDSYFEQHPEQFNRPEQIRVRQLLFSSKDEVLAKSVYDQIKSGKLSYQAAVEKYSIDQSSASRGGDMGFFTAKQRPMIAAEAFKLVKPNELSPLFKTQIGWHVLQYVERRAETTLTNEQARPLVRERLKAERVQKAEKELFEKLRAEVPVKIREEWVLEVATPDQREFLSRPATATPRPSEE